jgi:hypothetical protein
MDALPPTNRTLDEMDAAARDMGIVPDDPAYAFYTGLRRLYAEQRGELAQAINAIKAAQPKITDEQVKAMGNQLVRSFDSTAKRIASGLTVAAIGGFIFEADAGEHEDLWGAHDGREVWQ